MDPQQPMNYRFLQYSDPISTTANQSPSNPAVLTNYYNYYQQFNNSSYSTPNSISSSSDASSSSSLSPSTSYYYPNPSSSYYYNHYGSYYDYSQYQGNYYQSYANNQYNSSTPTEYQNQQPQLFDQSTSLDNSIDKAKLAVKTSAIRNLLDELEDEEHEKENEEEQENNTQGRKRRARTQFSIEQRRYLLGVFRQSSYPAKELLEQIAISMKVSVAVLQTWFKNTRSKQKKLTNRKNL